MRLALGRCIIFSQISLISAFSRPLSMSMHSTAAIDLANKISAGPKATLPQPGSLSSIQSAVKNDVDALRACSEDELDVADESGNTALIWASDRGNAEAVTFLTGSSKVDLCKRGFLGNTALSRACRQGHMEVVKTLLNAANDSKLEINGVKGARALGNIHNDKLQYPMHFAAFKLKPDVIQLLLDMGLDTTVLDRKGRTPAEDTSSHEIRDTILNARTLAEK